MMNGIFPFDLLSRSDRESVNVLFYKSAGKIIIIIIQRRHQLSSNPLRNDRLISCKGGSHGDIHIKGAPEHIKAGRKRRGEGLGVQSMAPICFEDLTFSRVSRESSS